MLDPKEGDTVVCDGCGDLFEFEDLTHHDDGNLYCLSCNYATVEDRMWENADRLLSEEQNR